MCYVYLLYRRTKRINKLNLDSNSESPNQMKNFKEEFTNKANANSEEHLAKGDTNFQKSSKVCA